ncbi:FAD-binding domain-containing protein [Thozetella sp. PMI_491]|nr:FAD-binding domain-containing protein [Thozetella sp. PMI_491]
MLRSLVSTAVWSVILFLPLVFASCTTLSSLLPGKVFFPDSTAYNASISSYFFLSQHQSPTCIVTPTSAEEVAKIVKAIGAKETGQVAVRSGGHSPNPGFSNTDHGFTVALRGLDQIAQKKGSAHVISVGTGALWIDVYKFLQPLNRTVVGSRVASVGVGGFITGDLLTSHGFACDNVKNMQVVLANGTIIEANATSNPRLFRALKGGQSNFGIVTRFDLMTHDTPEFWGGAIQYPESADAAQLAAFTAFKTSRYDRNVEIEQTTNNMFYTKQVANASGLHYFADIQPQTTNTMRLSQTPDFAQEIESLQPTDQFAIYATISFPISQGILSKVHSTWKNATNALAAFQPNITSVLTFQSIPPPPSSCSPPNSMPFTADSTPHHNIVLMLLSFYWSNKSDSATVERAARDLTALMQQLVGDDEKFKYLNYAASWQDPFGSYGETTVEELKQVANMYDPEGFFQNVVSGGFKLNSVKV